MSLDREKYISLFIDESRENLLALNDYLLELEKGIGELKLLNDIFRVAHTLKGMSSTMGFAEISELTHEMESLLDLLRNAQIPITAEIIDILFLCLDTLEALVDNVVSPDSKFVDVTNLMYRLKKILNPTILVNNELKEEKKDLKQEVSLASSFEIQYSDEERKIIVESLNNGYFASEIEVVLMPDCLMKSLRVLLVLQAIENKAKIIKTTPIRDDLIKEIFDQKFIVTILHSISIKDIKDSVLSIAEVLEANVFDIKNLFKDLIQLNKTSISQISTKVVANYTDTEKNALTEALNSGLKVYEIYISLMRDTIMKPIRLAMIMNTLDSLGCQVITIFPEGDLTDDNFIITVISDKEPSQIKNKIISIAEIEQTEILEISKQYLDDQKSLMFKKIELPEFTDYEKMIILESNNSGKRVLILSINLMPGTVMKFARYVLVTKKLEGLGDILKTIPAQEEIEAENFDDTFQIIFMTAHSDRDVSYAISTVAEVTNIVDLLPIVADFNSDFDLSVSIGRGSYQLEEEVLSQIKVNDIPNKETITKKDDFNLDIFADLLDGGKKEEIPQEEKQQTYKPINIKEPIKNEIASKPKNDSNITTSIEDDKKIKKTIQKNPTIRVDIERLDELVNLVEELIIIRSSLNKISPLLVSQDLTQTVRRLNMISSNLQNNAMKLRMVPVENIFNRFPRMIRDVAKSLNKEIEFIIEGEETELDRTIIDEIGDPLVHLLRNSADHGIESPEKRSKAGKSKAGKINLIARHEGNSVLIIVEDDGSGIDTARVKEKAFEKDLISRDDFDNMTDEDAMKIIFLPGFSTVDVTTELSGRGVGMDAVLSKVKSIGGTINISSQKGKGSRFTIKLPLTLAIMEVLLVKLGKETYAIPISYIEEVREILPNEIKNINKVKVTILRDKTIPLVDLSSLLGVVKLEKIQESTYGFFDEAIPIIIVRTEEGNKTSGLIVDSIIGQDDVVIKPLSKMASDKLNYISGTANLGDGNLALILNVTNLT